ncbi:MAG: hypothetical protein PHR06_07590 [Candidatus Cloacimonetes bacterium]|nr:hypothetical protein [Candidatus Cloacimonadota bacterium]
MKKLSSRLKPIIFFAIIALSIASIVYGYFDFEFEEIQNNALLLCLSCIGIG